jgi:hypothetical protein
MDGRPANVAVKATFRKTGGPPGGGYGIILRDQQPAQHNGVYQGGQFYVAEVGDRGEFGIWRRDNDHWLDLISWTHSDAVHAGQTPNALEARASGSELQFLANGVELARVQDASLGPGGVGAFAGGDGNVVALTDFLVDGSD